MSSPANNVVLVGMPGAGKSTLGVLLAKALGYDFVDSDLLIQRRAEQTLAAYIQSHGYAALRALEAEVIQTLVLERTVIATGGSAVYSVDAMSHLQAMGRIIYLRCPLAVLRQRIEGAEDRGIAAPAGQSLSDIEAERTPLYAGYANLTLDIGEGDMQAAATDLVGLLAR
jgi:shikimate kinase